MSIQDFLNMAVDLINQLNLMPGVYALIVIALAFILYHKFFGNKEN